MRTGMWRIADERSNAVQMPFKHRSKGMQFTPNPNARLGLKMATVPLRDDCSASQWVLESLPFPDFNKQSCNSQPVSIDTSLGTLPYTLYIVAEPSSN